MRNIDVLALIIDAAKNDDFERVVKLAKELQDKFCDNNCTWLDHSQGCVREVENTMALRDMFASNSAVGFLGLYDKIAAPEGRTKKQAIADLSYEMADALLVARKI